MACDVVWADVRAHFDDEDSFRKMTEVLNLQFDPLSATAAPTAGRLWREGRRASDSKRTRVVADFLIGAHALHQADSILTRDDGFYRAHFHGLNVTAPDVA